MLTPSRVIDRARSLHETFTEERHPNRTLAEELSDWQRDMLRKIGRVYSEEFRVTEVVDLPLSDFEAGYTFPDHTQVFQGVLYWNEDDWPFAEFNIEPEAHLTDPVAFPSAYLRGDTLHLMGREGDWVGYDRIEIPYVPAASEIDLGTDTSSLPDEASQAARYRLAEFMAGRKEDGPDIGYFRTRAEEAEEDLIDGMSLKGTAQVGKVRDVKHKRT